MSISRDVILDCSIEEVITFHEARRHFDAQTSSYVPEVYQAAAEQSYRRLNELEFELFHDDYVNGSANIENDMIFTMGENGVLLTAEHTTNHLRLDKDNKRKVKRRDYGTGSLALAAAKDTDSTLLVSLGRQTGDANRDIGHPFKDPITEFISIPGNNAHLSIHGLARALAANVRDIRGYSVQIGVGPKPSEATRTLVYDYLLPQGNEMGLKIGVNDPHLRIPNGNPVLSSDGKKIATTTFAGSGSINGLRETTRDYSQKVAKELSIDDQFVSAQLEISSVLRRHPDVEFQSQKDAWVGAHAGYLFVRMAAESASRVI